MLIYFDEVASCVEAYTSKQMGCCHVENIGKYTEKIMMMMMMMFRHMRVWSGLERVPL